MKIAVATDDGIAPARHFGQAPHYTVFTIEGGRIVAREQREKPVCDQHGAGGHPDQADDQADGPDLHTRMSDVISDCQVVLAAGIPGPMIQHLTGVGLRPFVVRSASAEDAVLTYLDAQENPTRR